MQARRNEVGRGDRLSHAPMSAIYPNSDALALGALVTVLLGIAMG